MTTEEILRELEAVADERAIRVWKRMGMDSSTYLGVSLTKVGTLAKRVGKNQGTALTLWETGIHDARLLSVHIAEPKKMTGELAEQWVNEAQFFDVTDRLAAKVVAKTAFAKEKMLRWMDADAEYVCRAGWVLLRTRVSDGKVTDEETGAYLARIEREIQSAPNWVREAQNYALIAIGSQDPEWNRKAREVVARIGKVVVDYGESSCQTPDAEAYLTHPRVTDRWKST